VSSQAFGQLAIQGNLAETTVGVPGATQRLLPPDPFLLQEFVRQDDLGRYRPLSGARTLPTGWSIAPQPELPLECILDIVYPLARTHQRHFAEGELRVVSLEDVLRRQSGRYESAAALPSAGRRAAVATVCGACVRVPVWDGAACAAADIPCPEPCSVMVSFCREAAAWHANPPTPAPVDDAVAWAAFDEPGNELRERYLSAMIEAHDER
jgi:hypothetical protein